MSRFKQTLWKYHDFMETFEVHAAFETVHDFILSDLCDVYLVNKRLFVIFLKQFFRSLLNRRCGRRIPIGWRKSVR